MPLNLLTKQAINEQIADYIDWFPVESIDDIPSVINTLEIFLKSEKNNSDQVDIKMRNSFEQIFSYIDNLLPYLNKDDTKEAREIIFSVINKRIEIFSSMSIKDKEEYISEYNTRKDNNKKNQKIMQESNPPNPGSDAHVISDEELHNVWQERENILNQLINNVLLNISSVIFNRDSNTLDDEAVNFEAIHQEVKIHLESLLMSVNNLFRQREVTFSDEHRLNLLRNLCFYINYGFNIAQILHLPSQHLNLLALNDYQLSSGEFDRPIRDNLDIDIQRFILSNSEVITEVLGEFDVSLQQFIKYDSVTIFLLIGKKDESINFIKQNNLNLSCFNKLQSTIKTNLSKVKLSLDTLNISLTELNNIENYLIVRSLLNQPKEIKMLLQAANLNLSELICFNSAIISRTESAMIFVIELGGEFLKKINKITDLEIILCLLEESEQIVKLIKVHNIDIDFLIQHDKGVLCYEILRGCNQFADMSIESKAKHIKEKKYLEEHTIENEKSLKNLKESPKKPYKP